MEQHDLRITDQRDRRPGVEPGSRQRDEGVAGDRLSEGRVEVDALRHLEQQSGRRGRHGLIIGRGRAARADVPVTRPSPESAVRRRAPTENLSA